MALSPKTVQNAGDDVFFPALLGFTAAFLFAVSAALQRRALLNVADTPGGRGKNKHHLPVVWLIRRLLRQRWWLAGWGTNVLGFGSQAAALHLGSVALVQPLLVTQLLFTLPMASAVVRQWPALRDWLSALAVSGGVALFLSLERADPMTSDPDRTRLLLALLVAVIAVAALLYLAQGRAPLLYSVLIAAGAGICYAMSAALIKITADNLLNRGIVATATDWTGYTLAVTALVGLLLGQQAYGSGSLSAAIAMISTVNPMASFTLGILAFEAPFSATPGTLIIIVVSGILLVLGVVGLAHSPAVQREATRAGRHGIYPASE